MNLQDVIASLVLLSLLVNVADRLLTRRGMLFAFPRSGRLRYFFTGWSIVLAALALLSLLHAVPVICFVAAGATWMICSQAYAVFSRHQQVGVRS